MGLNWVEIGTASMVLFAVIDIIGSIPLIIDLRQKVGHLQTEKASIVSLLIMIAFLFFRGIDFEHNWHRCKFFCHCWFIHPIFYGARDDFRDKTL